MNIKLDKYNPLIMYLSPASIPQIVAHIQDYLVKHPILSVETIAEIIVQSLQEHPELINGEAIPISAESQQSIKAYIDALPFLDTYTKAEINALLLGKQDTLTFDQAPTPGSSNPVTSSGIIAAMSALQSALETQINNKADRASTYTKTQVDTLLEDKADADDVYSKNTMDAKLLEVNTDIDNLEDDLSHQSKQIDEKTNQTNIAPVVTGTTATQNYKVNDLIIMEGVLYKVTTPILSGATFVPGTNITQTNIDNVISVLGSETIGFNMTSSDTLLTGGIYKAGKIVIVNFTMKSSRTMSNSPGIAIVTLMELRPKNDSALSAIDITSGISSSIESAIPCGVQAGGRIFIKSLTIDHIYAITGAYILN